MAIKQLSVPRSSITFPKLLSDELHFVPPQLLRPTMAFSRFNAPAVRSLSSLKVEAVKPEENIKFFKIYRWDPDSGGELKLPQTRKERLPTVRHRFHFSIT